MNKSVLLILFLFVGVVAFAQKTKNVSASYTYYAPETMSIEEAKRTALERAKIQAIADEFGTIVSQSSSTIVSNKNGESDTKFFSVGGSNVKGEWIETFGEPVYDIKFESHYLIVNCTVKGKAREIETMKIDFIAKTLRNGTTLKYESTEFKDGDDIYLYFISPVSGYLAVFLIDHTKNTVFNILPYRRSDGNAVRIEPDKEYIFFSKKECNELTMKGIVDEYILNCHSEKEFNDIIAIFSPGVFGKSRMNAGDMTIPNNCPLKDFKDWEMKIRKQNRSIQYTEIMISISKSI